MKSKHTPGPWKIGNMGAIYTEDLCFMIATVIGLDLSVGLEGARANARLIAAAPELLEACKLAERAWVGDGIDMSTAIDACLLAIRKAEE